MRLQRPRRRGWSLIELLIVITCVTTMLGFTAALLARLMRVDRAERARVVASAAIERLGRELRNDARAAIGPAELSDTRLVLAVPEGGSVEYAIRPEGVLRSFRRGGKTLGFDTFKRPSGTLARFEAGRAGSSQTVVLAFSVDPAATPTKAGDPAYSDYRIEAVPGRDARLMQGVVR
jgi:type II secretory pathway pseudopilin PulG